MAFTLLPTGIASAEAFGTALFSFTGRITIAGIPSGERIGRPTITRPTQEEQGIIPQQPVDPPLIAPSSPLLYTVEGSQDSTGSGGGGMDPTLLTQLMRRVREKGQISWDQLAQGSINLADIGVRLHTDLQGVQGGAPGDQFHWTLQEILDNQVRHWIMLEG